MTEHEREEREAQRQVPRETQAAIEARRGGGAALDDQVQERMAPALGDSLVDVRIHTDTSAGTLARSVGARAFATGSDVFFGDGQYRPGSPDGERLLAHELAHVVQQRGAPTSGVMRFSEPGDAYEVEAEAMADAAVAGRSQPRPAARVAGEPMVARDFVDDLKEFFGSEEQTVPRQPRPEPPKEQLVTKQDATQLIMLVNAPLVVAMDEISGEPDVNKAKSAAAKLEASAGAIRVLAGTKQDPANLQRMGAPLASIRGAQTTLEIMADPAKAKEIWKSNFEKALATVNELLALPIQAESTDPAQPAPTAPQSDSLTQRDHDLMEVSLKAPLQRLIETTSGEPYESWDPKVVAMDFSIPVATQGFSHPRMLSVFNQVNLGLQAVKAFAMSMNDQRNAAEAMIMSARNQVADLVDSFKPPESESAAAPPSQ